jgi:hypothetical protein
MRIKIVSDGHPHNTKVYTDDGKELKGIRSIKWEIGVNQIGSAKIEFVEVPVEIKGDLIEITKFCDHSSRYVPNK